MEEELLWAFIQSSFQHLMGICSVLGTTLGFGDKNTSDRRNLVLLPDKVLGLELLDLNSRFGLLVASFEHVI